MATIKSIYEAELRKAKKRAEKLPEGWTVDWPSTPTSYKELEKRIAGLRKISVKSLHNGETMPSYVKFSRKVTYFKGSYETPPITHTEYKEIKLLSRVAAKKGGKSVDEDLKIAFSDKEGKKRYKKGLKKRAKASWQFERDTFFRENFLSSCDTILAQAKTNYKTSTGEYKAVLDDLIDAVSAAKSGIEKIKSPTVAASIIKKACGNNQKIIDRMFGSSQFKLSKSDVARFRKIAKLCGEKYRRGEY